MATTEQLREQIFELIGNQMKLNDPPETKLTYDRLKRTGFSEFIAKQLIGQCLEVELEHIIEEGEEFDRNRFVKNLKNLPIEPYE